MNRTSTTPLRALLLATALLALPLNAQTLSASQDANAQAVAADRVMRNYHLRVAAELPAAGQARDLALAATLHRLATADEDTTGGESPATAWRHRAAQAAGEDVVANALLLMAIDRESDPVVEQAARRWAQAEPDNIVPVLFQPDGADALLANAHRFTRFDQHMYERVRWVQAALERHPPTASERAVLFGGEEVPAAEHAAISAMALVAVATPPLQRLSQACDDAALRATPTRPRDCEHLARVMADTSDSTLARMIGIDMLGRLADTPARRAEAQALRRRMDWQMFEWGRISAQQPRDGAPQFVRVLADPRVRTEQDLVERILTDAGVALEPPDGWQSPRR